MSRAGLAALAEVAAVTAAAHVLYKALKLLEPEGRNLAPGFVLLAAGAAMIALRRGDRAAYGVTWPPSREAAAVGAATGAAVVLVWLATSDRDTSAAWRWTTVLACAVAAARRPRLLERIPVAWSLLLVVASLAVPAWVARGVGDVAGRFVLAGIGEELFFRGYAQSRLNEAFGRPWRVLGTACGPGLVIASALFGLIHLLDPAAYFAGRFEVSWSWGAIAFLSGLVLGHLRETTGSAWTSALVHGTSGACGVVR